VKVGPVSLTYRGTAKFTERDAETRMVIIDASGKETRGAGTASAAVRASLEPSGEGTQVLMHTTMNVTGRPAQFGRGVIAEVGGKLVEQFAANLAQMISDGGAVRDSAGVEAANGAAADGAAADGEVGGLGAASSAAEIGAGTSSAESTPAVATEPGPGATEPAAAVSPPAYTTPAATTPAAPASQNEDSIDLVRLVGPAILKRLLPVAVAIAALVLLGRRFRHLLRRGKKA
jgi:hypothetical protein